MSNPNAIKHAEFMEALSALEPNSIDWHRQWLQMSMDVGLSEQRQMQAVHAVLIDILEELREANKSIGKGISKAPAKRGAKR